MIEDPAYGRAEAVREGFPDLDGPGFVRFLLSHARGKTVDDAPMRIEFEHLGPCASCGGLHPTAELNEYFDCGGCEQERREFAEADPRHDDPEAYWP